MCVRALAGRSDRTLQRLNWMINKKKGGGKNGGGSVTSSVSFPPQTPIVFFLRPGRRGAPRFLPPSLIPSLTPSPNPPFWNQNVKRQQSEANPTGRLDLYSERAQWGEGGGDLREVATQDTNAEK